MDWDDIIYVLLLLFSVGSGYFYRKISNPETKKSVGTLIGLSIVLIVSGVHIIHTLILTFVNIFIITFTSKRVCHLVSFAFSFAYLVFFRTTIYFGIPYPPAHTNLVIMILTLKLVGVAFELNTSYTRRKMDKKDLNEDILAEYEYTDIDPNCFDIFHYAFNYIGVLTGPYYTYRTYSDFLYKPYSKNTPYEAALLDKIMYIPLYVIIFLSMIYYWPFSYALSDEFYEERSWLYRLWYIMPTFVMFRMRLYVGMILSECVCVVAGLGAYPKFTNPKPGRGPSTNFTTLNSLKENDVAEKEFDFEAIHNIKPYETEFSTTFRETVKDWNMSIQYWMAVNVYKRFPSKKFRTLATLLVSAFWHGVYIGHYFCICSAPFYFPVEDLYYKLFVKNNKEKSATFWNWIIFLFKMPMFSYFGMAFQLLTVPKVMRYYNSIYHVGELFIIITFIIGTLIQKSRRKQLESKTADIKTN